MTQQEKTAYYVHQMRNQVPHFEERFPELLRLLDIPSPGERRAYFISLIEKGFSLIKEGNKERAQSLFFLLSETHEPDDLASFCTDAMLVAEDDFEGEFKSIAELERGFEEIRNS
jgi:hypothetical protein